MFLAPWTTARIWCSESNIYKSDITNSLLIFSFANLGCQISLLNFKGCSGWRNGRNNEVEHEPFGAHISGLLIDGLLVGRVICYIVLHRVVKCFLLKTWMLTWHQTYLEIVFLFYCKLFILYVRLAFCSLIYVVKMCWTDFHKWFFTQGKVYKHYFHL